MSETTVLVTSAGTASGVNVIRSLRLADARTRVVATDMDPWAAGIHLADRGFISPVASSPGFEPFLFDLVSREKISAIFPIHSSEIAIVAGLSSKLKANGVHSLLASASAVRACDDKRGMTLKARELGVAVPVVYDRNEPVIFPVFVKPNASSGSRGAGVANSQEELDALMVPLSEPFVQQFVSGKECTVDCLVAANGQCLSVSPRWRTRVQGGQSHRGETFHDDELESTCERIIGSLGMVGPCNLQFIRNEQSWVFLEINPRWAAGGLMLTVHAGANLPQMALQTMLGKPVLPARTKSAIRITRYMAEAIHSAEVEL
jgi:carbamoyl-phosphate synthase large subunit